MNHMSGNPYLWGGENVIIMYNDGTQAMPMDLNRPGTDKCKKKKHKSYPSFFRHTFSDVEVSPMDKAHHEHQSLLF